MIDRDQFQLTQTPVVPIPCHRALDEDERQAGHRYLVSGNGVFLEVIRSWIHIVTRIGRTEIEMPFGIVEEKHHITCGALPRILLHQFLDIARAALPNEAAAIIIWNEHTKQFRLLPTAVRATVGIVQYEIPPLDEGEYRVVDIHSHGHIAAYFSDTDDADDKHDVKIAVVVGNVGDQNISMAARICVLGKYIAQDNLLGGPL